MLLIFATILRRYEEGSRIVVGGEVDGGDVQCKVFVYTNTIHVCLYNAKAVFCE